TRSALTLRPALVALVPSACRCTDVVKVLAKEAHGIGVSLAVVAPGSRDADVSALPGQVPGIKTWYDATGALASAFDAHGVTVLAAAVLVGQLSIGWANDYVDAGRDRAVGRTDKPLARRALPDGIVGTAAAIALLADVPLSLGLGARPGAAHLVAVGSAWLYDT